MAFFRHLRSTFFVILIFQLSIGNVLAGSGDGSTHENSDLTATATSVYSDEVDRFFALDLLTNGADKLDDNTFYDQDPKNFDIFRTEGQKVEIYKNNEVATTYSLDDSRVGTPPIAFTNFTPRYNIKTRELIFEAKTGAKPDGTGGTIIARHIIPDMDIVGLTYDRDILSMIDSRGRLHAIDMAIAIHVAFHKPLLVFQNLYVPLKPINLSARDVRMEYVNAGVRPYASDADLEGALIPRDINGNVDLERKLMVRYMDGNKEKLLGLFSNKKTEEKMKKGTAFAFALKDLITMDLKGAQFFQENRNNFEQTAEMNANNIIATEEVLSPLRIIDLDYLKALKNRQEFYNNPNRRSDKIPSVDEWRRRHAKIEATAKDPKKLNAIAEKAKVLQETAATDEHKKIYRDVYAQFLADAEAQQRLLQDGNLAKAWQVLEEPEITVNPFHKDATAKKSINTTERASEWKIIGLVGGVLAAYLSGSFAGSLETTHQVQALSWLYEHMYPSVLKDADYRLPLSLSIAGWVAVWPATLAMSFTFQKALNIASSGLKNSNSWYAQYIRELHKTWSPLSDWQRIVSIGMRSYSYVIYPYLRVSIESLLRQKSFLSAYENKMNPFRIIRKDSELGQQIGLTKTQTLGFNNPFLGKKSLAQTTEQKIQIQSAIERQKIRTDSLAWLLATAVVAEKNQIDPATLTQISQGRADSAKLNEIFSKPENQRDWELLSSEIRKDLSTKNALTLNREIKDLSPDRIAEFYQSAQKAAELLKQRSDLKKNVALRWKRFKSIPLDLVNFMLLQNGQSDAKFLRGLITNKFVTGQIKQGFRNDHLMTDIIPSVYGERADLTHPEFLAADPNGFMYTSRAHNNDMAQNTTAHFFIAGASLALIYQKLRAEQETNYLPSEDFSLASDVREEGFGKGLKNWAGFGYNERENKPENMRIWEKPFHFMYHIGTEVDPGGKIVKRVQKRFTTLQSGITLSILFRKYMGHQDFHTALSAWALMFLAGQWAYGWVWDPIQMGNNVIDQKFEASNTKFRDIKYNIAQGLKNNDMTSLEAGYSELAKLYEQQNPEALEKLKSLLNSSLPDQSLTPIEREYYGILAKLAKANATNNKIEFDQTIELLRRMIVEKQGYNKDDVAKLNAESLLEFSRSNPPIYTHPHKYLSGFFTWIGAVSSTALYIPLSIMLFSKDSLSADSLLNWLFVSAGLYGATYAVFGKKAWLAYERFYDKIKPERLGGKPGTLSEKVHQNFVPALLKPKPSTGAVCSSLFR
jgi:hypothetical protein